MNARGPCVVRLAALFACLTTLACGHASAQAPILLQPVPVPPPAAPVMGPPVIVMPGQPTGSVVARPPSLEGNVSVSVPACPAGVPCPPPCPVGLVCPPPPCVCDAQGLIVVVPPSTTPPNTTPPNTTITGTTIAAPVEVVPSEPAPGTFALGYVGAFDGRDVLHGGALRFTGHLEDVWFLEAVLGGQGASTASRDIGEVILLLGPRVGVPLVTPNLRLYVSLDTGVLIRNVASATWGIWSTQLGGGLEFGGEIDTNWSIGGYVDVRAEGRVPFEREPASIGLVWSAGLAFLWF